MKKSFYIDSFAFFYIDSNKIKLIFDNLIKNYKIYEIPNHIWKNELSNIPSPIKKTIYCSACYTTGPIPTTTASMGDTFLDIIIKENNPKKYEPDYNVYRQYLIKNSDGKYYISEPTKPNHHWAVVSDLKEMYDFKP